MNDWQYSLQKSVTVKTHFKIVKTYFCPFYIFSIKRQIGNKQLDKFIKKNAAFFWNSFVTVSTKKVGGLGTKTPAAKQSFAF